MKQIFRVSPIQLGLNLEAEAQDTMISKSAHVAAETGRFPKKASLALGLLIISGPVCADSRDDCDHAARTAANAQGIPVDTLLALTRVETGRTRKNRFGPWPWTVNLGGQGLWFETKTDAVAFAQEQLNSGRRDFDIGCFQLSFKWHQHGFRSIEEMLDPVVNARYAAWFLADLYSEFGTWDAAVGAYHSRTAERAEKYLSRYKHILANLHGEASSSETQNFLRPRAGLTRSGPTTGPFRNKTPLISNSAKPTPFIGLN